MTVNIIIITIIVNNYSMIWPIMLSSYAFVANNIKIKIGRNKPF